jgi:predicted Zn finger-like uncharacterized protein
MEGSIVTKMLACPACGVNLRVASATPAGKRVKCPKCGEAFPVPADDEPRDEEEVAERPAPRKRRKKPKKAARNTALVLGLAIGGAVLLTGAAVTAAVVFWPSGTKTEPVAENTPAASRSAGPVARPEGRPGSGRPGAGSRGAERGQEPAERGQGQGQERSAGGAEPSGGEADPLAAGRRVFEANNCTRCHTIGGGGQRGRGRGPDLGAVGRDPEHTVEWLMEHVRNPKSHRPESRMPAYGRIPQEDLRALATYLASLK